jgi:flavin-dependent dehydrogenase
MARMNPITIAGGGLAGLTLGLALRRKGVPVSLHEAGTYPRHRVCGEFLNGTGRDVLESLGLGEIFSEARRQSSTAWFYRGRKIYEAALPAPAWGISRFALDDAMQRMFRDAGGELIQGSRMKPVATPGHVWCGGRIPGRSRWIGLKCHVPGLALKADLEMHLAENGYVGLARVEGGAVNVCGLFHCDTSLRTLPAYLRGGKLEVLADRIEAAGPVESSCAAVAGFETGWQKERPGLLAVGDACGMIPPYTGNGMSMACEAAMAVCEPLSDYADGRIGWEEACGRSRRFQRSRFGRRLAWAQIFHPFLTELAGQAFLAAVSRTRLLPFGLAFRLLR